MRVAIPKVSRYSDSKGTVTLEIPNPQSGKKPQLIVTEQAKTIFSKKKKTHVWHDSILPPSKVLISPQTRSVVLLGSLGDAGSGLGEIVIRGFSGEVLKEFNLHRQIPDIDDMASDYGDMGNFPWIEEAKLSEDGFALSVNVCRKKLVRISLSDFSIQVSDL